MVMTIDTPRHDMAALRAAGPDLQPVGEEDIRAHQLGQSVAQRSWHILILTSELVTVSFSLSLSLSRYNCTCR